MKAKLILTSTVWFLLTLVVIDMYVEYNLFFPASVDMYLNHWPAYLMVFTLVVASNVFFIPYFKDKLPGKLKHVYVVMISTVVSIFFLTLYWGFVSLDTLPNPYTLSIALELITLPAYVISLLGYIIFYIHYVSNFLEEAGFEMDTNIMCFKKNRLTTRHVTLGSIITEMKLEFLVKSLNLLQFPKGNDKDYPRELTDLYEYFLAKENVVVSALESELNFLDSYMFLIQDRFENSIDFVGRVSVQYLKRYLPTHALQIVMENAILHNCFSDEIPLNIRLYIDIGSNSCVVESDFRPKKTHRNINGKGLANIQNRYRMFSQKEIVIEQTTDKFKVYLPLL